MLNSLPIGFLKGTGVSVSPVTPPAPTGAIVSDSLNTFNWTHPPGYTTTDEETTVDGGTTWDVAIKPLVVGNVNKSVGQVGVRVRASGINPASSILFNASPYTFAGVTPAAPTSPITDDNANTFDWTHPAGYSTSDEETTVDGGATYIAAVKPLVIGNSAKSINQVGVRVKAQNGNFASSTLFNTTAFTITSSNVKPLFVLAGQSNTGYPSISNSAAFGNGFNPLSLSNQNLYAITHNARTMRKRNFPMNWEQFTTGNNSANNDGAPDAINIMSSSIRKYNDLYPGVEPYLFHAGKGGVPLAIVNGGQSWYPFGSPSAGLYDNEYQGFAMNAVTKAVDLGVVLDFKASVWMQGETDCEDNTAATNYGAALVQHFVNERNYWQAAFSAAGWGTVPNYRKIIIKIRPYAGFSDLVRAAQTSFCNNSANNAVLIDVDDVNPGQLHFQPDGDVEVGLRIFDQIKFL